MFIFGWKFTHKIFTKLIRHRFTICYIAITLITTTSTPLQQSATPLAQPSVPTYANSKAISCDWNLVLLCVIVSLLAHRAIQKSSILIFRQGSECTFVVRGCSTLNALYQLVAETWRRLTDLIWILNKKV